MISSNIVLKANSLTKIIENKIILNQVSFEILNNEIFVLIGSNGVGKSVLIRCLLGLETISEGTVEINGSLNRDRLFLRRQTGLVASDHIDHLNLLTPSEYFEFIINIFQIPSNYAINFIDQTSRKLFVEPHLKTPIVNLSFGTRKKIQLLGVLLYQPKILFCDEIFEGLDSKSVTNILEIIKNYVQNNCSVFLTTHISSLAKEISDKYCVLENGCITNASWE
ncbi:ATP-binding cassette domain-containing protein [Paenibacillus tyrfis]|uniref:ATP-binding cassette domain-containing protein n=1 Tax=Paenibacillus tyrfis TaxID=1501230 RepID=UPI0009DEC73E|nr:ABC transporter ATP-binding protein [Paenibacillus tyrfis]